MSLKVTKLSGGYFNQYLLKDISFEITPGEIVGLLGLNGAGKSTLYKSLMGQLPNVKGQIQIDQIDLKDDFETYQKNISYLPERPVFYPELTLWEHLELLQRLFELPRQSLIKAKQLLKDFHLNKFKDRKPHYFSKGMQQKVMIVQTLIQDSQILLLDEPFSGLDPLAVFTLRNLLHNEREEGKIILLTTHLLHEAEQLCDRYLWLKEGELVLDCKARQMNDTASSLEELYLQMLNEGELADE